MDGLFQIKVICHCNLSLVCDAFEFEALENMFSFAGHVLACNENNQSNKRITYRSAPCLPEVPSSLELRDFFSIEDTYCVHFVEG